MKVVKLLSIDKKRMMQTFLQTNVLCFVLAAIFEKFYKVLNSISTWQACQLGNHDCLKSLSICMKHYFQVSLGKTNDLLAADYEADQLPTGCNSTKGLGKIAPKQDEYVTLYVDLIYVAV